MASLISWLNPFEDKKKNNSNGLLNTLTNFDVRTNNAAINRGATSARQTTPTTNQSQVQRVSASNNFSQNFTTRAFPTTVNNGGLLNTLNNLDIRNRNQNRLNSLQSSLSKINSQNGGINDSNGKMSFDDFKATMSAKNIIDNGGTGAPYKASAIKNAEAIRNADQSSPLAKLNNMTTLVSSKNYNAQNDNGWKRYYDEEFKKARDEQNFFQRLIDQGSASRLAETNARNRYATELLNKAFDDEGNVKDQNIANNVKTLADYNSGVAKAYNEMEHAKSRKIGASYDSDYYTGFDWDPAKNKAGTNGDLGKALELLGKQLKGTANVIRNMSVADAITGANNTQKTDLADAGKFVLDLVPGMLTAPIQGGTNIAESISGSGTDAETGKERSLDALERTGRGLSGAIDAAGVFFGGSGDLINSVGKSIFRKGASETTKQVLKQTGKEVLKDYIKAMVEEGAEEGVQQAFEFFGDGGKLITKDGEFDAEAFNQLLQESGQAAALGAVGGGIFHAGGDMINFANNKIRDAKTSTPTGSNISNKAISNAVTSQGIKDKVQTQGFTQDGMAVKTNENGQTVRLSDSELARVATTNLNENINTTEDLVENGVTNTSIPVQGAISQTQVADYAPENSANLQTQGDTTSRIQSLNTLNRVQDSEVQAARRQKLADLAERADNGDAQAQAELIRMLGETQNNEQDSNWRGESVQEVVNPEENDNPIQNSKNDAVENTQDTDEKQRQLDVINKNNPMRDDQHTGVRSINDIKTYEEIMQNPNFDEEFVYPDWSAEDAATMMANGGKVLLFSSKPFEEGGFVTPSKMMAQDYAGNGTVYSKLVDVADVAWINGDEGQYAPRSNSMAAEVIPNNQTQNNSPSIVPANDTQSIEVEGKRIPLNGSDTVMNMNETADTRSPQRTTGTETDGSIVETTQLQEDEDISVRTPEQQRYDSQTQKGEVDSLIEVLNTPSGEHSFVTLLKGVSNKVKKVIKDAIGVDVSGYRHTIDSSSVKHVLNDHANDAIPLSPQDFNLVPDIIKNADSVEYSGKNNRGLDVITYTKQYNDKIAYLEEIRNGRHQLAMNTMYWIGKGQQKSGPTGEFSENSTNSLRALSRPVGDTANSLSQNTENVNSEKLSSFADNTARYNENISREARQALRNDPLSYTPVTNEERLARANEILNTKSIDEIDTYLRDNYLNNRNPDSADTVLAGEFSKRLDSLGQYDRATELINKISALGTKQGQQIQALSLMMNRTPEGIANMAQNSIKKSGGEVTGEIRQAIVEQTTKIGQERASKNNLAKEGETIGNQIINGEGDVKALRKRQAEIAQEYREHVRNEAKAFEMVAKVVDKNSKNKNSIFGSVYRAALLSGPRTHTGNAVSNTFQNMLNAGADRLAAGIDWVRSSITGTERQVVGSAGGRIKGLKEGLGAAGEVLRTGTNLWEGMSNATESINPWGQGGEMEFKNKIANAMVAKPTNFIFRAMSAGDLPFRYTAFENAVRTEAKRQGINQGYRGQALQDYINMRVATPDPELQAYGIDKGNASVYDEDTLLSDMVKGIDSKIASLNKSNPVAGKVAEGAKTILMPFVKVPSRVLTTAMDWSPVGTVKAIVNKIGSKNYTTGQFEVDLSKSGLGTAGFLGLGYALSAAGALTGAYPSDKDEQKRWEAEGIKEGSIKIGDKYVSLNYFGPASMLLSMGAGIQQRQAQGQDAMAIVSGSLADAGKTFMEQSFVQGLNEFANAITDSDRYGESYLKSLVRGLVPNLLRQTAIATDPYQRQTDTVGDAVISGIPGLSQSLPAKVDAYGREIENSQTLPLGQMWDALKLSNARETTDLMKEVDRLRAIEPNDGDYNATPTTTTSSIKINGETVQLTNEQQHDFKVALGNAANESMTAVMNSEGYKSMSDEEKASALTKAYQNAHKAVREQFKAAIQNGTPTGNIDVNGEEYATGAARNSIKISSKLADEYRSTLEKYNSMSSESWEKYIYGNSAEAAAAEYNLAKAKYENDMAEGNLTTAQQVKRQKELAKLEISKGWTKNVRDFYALAGSKSDMQAALNMIDDENTRAELVGMLNGLNNAMYEAGIITASTYKTRGNAINNITTSKSKKSSGSSSSTAKKNNAISSAEAGAISKMVKSLSDGVEDDYNVEKTKAPTTNRKMTRTRSKGNNYATKTYTPKKATISVKKGATK